MNFYYGIKMTPIEKQFYRPADVKKRYGISHATVFRWIKSGKLPAPQRLSARVIGWDKDILDEIFLK
jgi:predicted DNA-binding transcriptional regulator AlpA